MDWRKSPIVTQYYFDRRVKLTIFSIFDELFAVQRHADMHYTDQLVADLMDILSVESPTILRGCLEATGSSGLAIHRHGTANDESTK